jgi:hypothetical protein
MNNNLSHKSKVYLSEIVVFFFIYLFELSTSKKMDSLSSMVPPDLERLSTYLRRGYFPPNLMN